MGKCLLWESTTTENSRSSNVRCGNCENCSVHAWGQEGLGVRVLPHTYPCTRTQTHISLPFPPTPLPSWLTASRSTLPFICGRCLNMWSAVYVSRPQKYLIVFRSCSTQQRERERECVCVCVCVCECAWLLFGGGGYSGTIQKHRVLGWRQSKYHTHAPIRTLLARRQEHIDSCRGDDASRASCDPRIDPTRRHPRG